MKLKELTGGDAKYVDMTTSGARIKIQVYTTSLYYHVNRIIFYSIILKNIHRSLVLNCLHRTTLQATCTVSPPA